MRLVLKFSPTTTCQQPPYWGGEDCVSVCDVSRPAHLLSHALQDPAGRQLGSPLTAQCTNMGGRWHKFAICTIAHAPYRTQLLYLKISLISKFASIIMPDMEFMSPARILCIGQISHGQNAGDCISYLTYLADFSNPTNLSQAIVHISRSSFFYHGH